MTEEELLEKVKFELRREFESERNLLEKVKVILKDYEKKRKDNALGFNIFDITGIYFDGGMGNKSVYENPMQRVLYELLNPEGSHGMGTAYLKQFFQDVLHFDTDDYELENTKLKIEKTVSQGRIDITIETPYRFIPIEIKTKSAEGENQCARYINVAKEKNKNKELDWKLFFLTPDGIDANLNESEKKYCCSISWKNDITTWLENIIEISHKNRANVLEIIKQYLATVKKFTNQNEEGLQMELNKLINDSETMKAALAISKGLESVRNGLIKKLFNEIDKKFGENHTKIFERYDNEYPALAYEIKEINESYVLAISFEFNIKDSNSGCYIGFIVSNKEQPGNQSSKDIGEVFENAKGLIRKEKLKNTEHTDSWFGMLYVPTFKNFIDKEEVPDFKNFNDAYCDLFDDGKRQYFVNQVVNGFSELISWVN